MRCDNNNQNLYTNSDNNGVFDHHQHEQQLPHNHYHHEPLTLFSSETFQGSSNNGGIVSAFDQISNHQTASNNLNLHPQGGSPIGLSLRKSSSLINLVEMTLSQERQQKKAETPTTEKLKASNFRVAMLQIGSWKRISRNEGDLVAKLYYAKKKLVWEFLDGPLKNKIEIQWSEISAIRAFMYEGEPGLLEIELNQQPQFGREINPQPRKHTQWKQTVDFTQGQASICRRHSIIFPPGVLDKQYEKLLQCDNRLFNLSQKPFPVNNYPFFYHDSNACLDYSYINVHHQPPSHFLGDPNSNLPMSVIRFPYSDESTMRDPHENHERGSNRLEGIHVIPNLVRNHLPYNQEELWTPVQQSQTQVLFEEIDSTVYVNEGISSIDQIHINYGTVIHEPTSWTSVSDFSGLPCVTVDLGGLYGNQHNNPNWT